MSYSLIDCYHLLKESGYEDGPAAFSPGLMTTIWHHDTLPSVTIRLSLPHGEITVVEFEKMRAALRMAQTTGAVTIDFKAEQTQEHDWTRL